MRRTVPLLFVLALAFTALVTPQTVRAQADPAKDALVAELVQLLQFDRMIEQTMTVMAQQVEQGIRAKAPNAPQKAIDDVVKIVEDESDAFMRTMFTDLMPLMGKYYTTDELRQIVEFYKTPVGQKAINIMPQLMTDLQRFMAPRLQQFAATIGPKVQKRMEEAGYGAQ